MKETLTLAGKLLLITAIVAALLGAVNTVTAPMIEKNTEITFNENLKEILPEADKFDLDGTKLPETDGTATVSGVYCGMKEDGTVVGYVADALSPEGYGGDVAVMVGADVEGKITRVKVTEMSETPGLGAKCQSDWIDQYSGLVSGIVVSKNGSAGDNPNKIDAISGATITSNAVTSAVNASLDAIGVVINDNHPAEAVVEEGAELAADGEIAEEVTDEFVEEVPEEVPEEVSEEISEDEAVEEEVAEPAVEDTEADVDAEGGAE